jgi:hypothetical protein
MTPAITDERFGAWVLKCNPRTWDLEGFLADGGNVIEDWSVQTITGRPGCVRVTQWCCGSPAQHMPALPPACGASAM